MTERDKTRAEEIVNSFDRLPDNGIIDDNQAVEIITEALTQAREEGAEKAEKEIKTHATCMRHMKTLEKKIAELDTQTAEDSRLRIEWQESLVEHLRRIKALESEVKDWKDGSDAEAYAHDEARKQITALKEVLKDIEALCYLKGKLVNDAIYNKAKQAFEG